MASYQDLNAKCVWMMAPKCSIVEDDRELMLMALHTHFLLQQQYSRVYGWVFTLWFIDEDVSFFHFFHKITNIRLLFFQNPYAIFTHILHFYHNLQSNVAIFSRDVQAYALPCSFGGRIKLTICQIRHELNVTIHKKCSSWKKVR